MKTAFDIIQKINNLSPVKGTKNIYVNDNGDRFYKTRFGFHNNTQYGNLVYTNLSKDKELFELEKEKYAEKLKNISQRERDIIGRKRLKTLKSIVGNFRKSPEEKIELIKDYLQ